MLSGSANCQNEKIVKRARRFSLNGEMRFRLPGDKEWRQGKLQNMSMTGLLFRSQSRLEPGSQVNVSIDIPGTGRAGTGLRALGTSTVIRVVGRETEPDFLIAGRFTKSQIARQLC